MKFCALNVLVFVIAFQSLSAADSLRVTSPVSRIVYQRDLSNTAKIKITGFCPDGAKHVKARFLAREKGQGKSTNWQVIDQKPSSGSFAGSLTAKAGWYDLEVCSVQDGGKETRTRLERVGVGEVFIIVGHSVAQGGEINIEGSADDRVSTIMFNENSDSGQMYLRTADPKYLPAPHFVHAASGIAHAPFGHNSYFWSKFGEYVARKNNVPVLIYNAAFGGTSLEHWSKAARSIPFEHGFVKSALRMPYINLSNAMLKYGSLTGFRAILADQGQNDNQQKSADTIFQNYKIFVDQARKDINFPSLTVVVNRQTPGNAPQVRVAQERMLEQPHSYPGPDYDKGLLPADRYDAIHLSESGLRKAAVLWADALDAKFFSTVKPWIPADL